MIRKIIGKLEIFAGSGRTVAIPTQKDGSFVYFPDQSGEDVRETTIDGKRIVTFTPLKQERGFMQSSAYLLVDSGKDRAGKWYRVKEIEDKCAMDKTMRFIERSYGTSSNVNFRQTQ